MYVEQRARTISGPPLLNASWHASSPRQLMMTPDHFSALLNGTSKI